MSRLLDDRRPIASQGIQVRRRRILSSVLLATLFGAEHSAHAIETGPIDDKPAQIDVTESFGIIANTDNRNSRRADVPSEADDDWGMVSNRLNAQASWGHWQLGLRVDSVLYYTSRSPTDIALDLLERERRGRPSGDFTPEDGDFFVQKFFQAGDELSDRFVSWTYPAKYSLTYKTPALELTVGDYYAQFGRGLVLSVRKDNELTGDNTIRGARVTTRLRGEDMRFELTGLVGSPNPLRIDPASGRHLGTMGDVRSGFTSLTEAGMPTMVDSSFVPDPRANFAPDVLYGFQLEGKSKAVAVSLAGTHLDRTCVDGPAGCEPLANDLVRSAAAIDTAGISLAFPDLWSKGALYLEYAHQWLRDFRSIAAVEPRPAVDGGALYGSLNLYDGPLTFTLEGKHYRRFYPLRANVDIGKAREFVPVQFSTPPTTMPVWNDTEFEGFNTCVTGGRGQLDVRLGPRASVFGWIGRYNTWAESVAAATCDVDDANLNRVWDFAQGVGLSSADRKSHADASVGARFDSTDRYLVDERGDETNVFYREVYTRYDVVQGLPGGNSLQFQGWHRRRRQTLGGPSEPWLQGITTTALQWGPKLNLAFGFEYDQNPAFPDVYFNGQVRYELDGEGSLLPWKAGPSHVALFAGQRQGGLRCVSGVCRVFPPFEGVRLDLTLGF